MPVRKLLLLLTLALTVSCEPIPQPPDDPAPWDSIPVDSVPGPGDSLPPIDPEPGDSADQDPGEPEPSPAPVDSAPVPDPGPEPPVVVEPRLFETGAPVGSDPTLEIGPDGVIIRGTFMPYNRGLGGEGMLYPIFVLVTAGGDPDEGLARAQVNEHTDFNPSLLPPRKRICNSGCGRGRWTGMGFLVYRDGMDGPRHARVSLYACHSRDGATCVSPWSSPLTIQY